MLGEKIFEWTGKVQGQRILPPVGDNPRMEITFGGPFQGAGRLSAFKGIGTATYWAISKPDGIFAGEGHGIIMSDSGEGFSSTGFGLGRLNNGKFTYRGAATFHAAAANLNWLNGVVGVFEFEQDMNTQNIHFICFEWK